jgi:predicted nuclease of restriction endonuclease-like (RecB) superfamily
MQEYEQFLSLIKERIYESKYRALKAVNDELIALYWDLGKIIVQKQQEEGWGKSIVEKLSADLKESNLGVQGFSVSNLWYMRQFYLEYKDKPNLQPLVGEIGWSHNTVIFSKCKDDLEREFYILHTKKFGWTKNVLIHQIENKTYQKYLLNQTNFDNTLPADYSYQASLSIKDNYTFDFLELSEQHSEYDLENALISNIRKFLAEMGHWYTFVGNQYRLTVGENEYFIDLLLYHRKLRALIAIELKVGDFLPEYKGKMEFYLTALNRNLKEENENDAIGIIICKSKDKTVVEYSLSSSNHPIGVSTYTTNSNLPQDYQKYIPDKETISRKLEQVRVAFNSNKTSD